ncbi:hypothetical protein Tco_0550759 [Tanacetum coccineum]
MKETANKSNKERRILNVSSCRHHRTVSIVCIYILMYSSSMRIREMESRLIQTQLIHEQFPPIYSAITTFLKVIPTYLDRDVHQGATTTCYVALHPQVQGISGKYFGDSNLAEASSQANDAELTERLWDFTEKLIKEHSHDSHDDR